MYIFLLDHTQITMLKISLKSKYEITVLCTHFQYRYIMAGSVCGVTLKEPLA